IFFLEPITKRRPADFVRFGVAAVVQVAFEVGPSLLGDLRVVGAGRLALAAARVRVDPLEHQGRAVLGALRPDGDTLVGQGGSSFLRTPRRRRPVLRTASAARGKGSVKVHFFERTCQSQLPQNHQSKWRQFFYLPCAALSWHLATPE